MGLEILGAIGGGLDIAGTWYNNREAQERQNRANDANQENYAKRYQLEVQDLMKAGLNPMLAYSQGAGSIAGSSAASPGQTSSLGSNVVSSYNQSKIASAQEANIEAQTQKTLAEKSNIDLDSLSKVEMPAKIKAETSQALQNKDTARELAINYQYQIKKMEQEIKTLKTQSDKNKSDKELADKYANAVQFQNALKQAETFLTQASTSLKHQEYDTNEPKRRAAGYWSAEAGERGKNMWNLFSPFK